MNNNRPPKVSDKYKKEYISEDSNKSNKEIKNYLEIVSMAVRNYLRGFKFWWRIKNKDNVIFVVFLISVVILGAWYVNSNRVDDSQNTVIDDSTYVIETYEFRTHKPLEKLEINNLETQSSYLENPKTIDFQWEYNGKQYKLTETFYKSVYDYYSEQPKYYTYYEDDELSDDWAEEWFGIFLKRPQSDNSISQIVLDIESLGWANGLDEDQILELVVSFAQSIPYDDIKAQQTEILPRFPYEVLYDNKGVCSGKTFLTAALVQELGYGVALFEYEEDQHMALGIQCPKSYASYNSDYCYTETTEEGWKIGIIPADDLMDIQGFKNGSVESEPIIYKVSEGKIYQGIIKTRAEEDEIKSFIKESEKLEIQLVNIEQRLNVSEKELNYLEKYGSYAIYNNKVYEYNRLFSEYQYKTDRYNALIKSINNFISTN